MKGQPRFFSSLEMLILSLRKEGKKGEEDEAASEDHAPKKSPRPERRDPAPGNASPSASTAVKAPISGSPSTSKSPRVQALMGGAAAAAVAAPVPAPVPVADEKV